MSPAEKQTLQDPTLTVEDFRQSGWRKAFGQSDRENYVSISQAFYDEGNRVNSCEHPSKAKVLHLLADACSMVLSPDSANEPFKPLRQSRTRRGIVPDDFRDADIAFFAEILDEVDNPRLIARLADLLWLRTIPRNPKFALTAIDNYRAIPLTAKSWFADARHCWERARVLVAMLGKGSGDRWAEIRDSVLIAFRAAGTRDNYFGLQLAEFLEDYIDAKAEQLSIASQLQQLAEAFERDGNRHAAQDYFDGAAGWFKRGGDAQQSTTMIVATAECFAKEGDERLVADQPSHTAAGLLYERAIQKYRSVPKAERGQHGVEERLADLHQRVQASGLQSLGEMNTIETPSVDLSEVADRSRQAVTGKAPLDALGEYLNLHAFMNAEQLRSKAIENLKAHPLQALLSTVVVADDGRIVAKRSGVDLNAMDSERSEAAIRAEMVNSYVMYVHGIVYGVVLPGLEVLRLEHRLREGDFRGIAARSLSVPPGREGLFGKALFAGYEWDFVTAIHILAPQVEHMVRFHLKYMGIRTTTVDSEGVEAEVGLSALMNITESARIWGDDVAFEIKALFCDSVGPNIRNDVAHGLFSEEKCKSTTSVYAWWLGLKIVFNTFRHVVPSETQDRGSQREGTVGGQ